MYRTYSEESNEEEEEEERLGFVGVGCEGCMCSLIR